MKAMIFAAGLGTRLRPYTNDKPKALVEVGGKSLLFHTIMRLYAAGVTEVVVNVHHFAPMVIAEVQRWTHEGIKIHISDESDLLLDTGGGLLHAKRWLDGKPFLIHNVDIMSNISLWELYHTHLTNPALATLAVRQRTTSRYLEFDGDGVLSGWVNAKSGERKVSRPVPDPIRWAYSGIAVIDPALFAFFPTDERVFSIIDVWLAAAQTGIIRHYPHDPTDWLDVGQPAALPAAEALVQKWFS